MGERGPVEKGRAGGCSGASLQSEKEGRPYIVWALFVLSPYTLPLAAQTNQPIRLPNKGWTHCAPPNSIRVPEPSRTTHRILQEAGSSVIIFGLSTMLYDVIMTSTTQRGGAHDVTANVSIHVAQHNVQAPTGNSMTPLLSKNIIFLTGGGRNRYVPHM